MTIGLSNARVLGATVAIAVAACLVAAAVYAKPKPITNRQAISFLKGKTSLPAISGGTAKRLPTRERAYAVRVYRSAPYKRSVLNLFYAVGAAAVHYMPKKKREELGAALALLGRDGLEDQAVQGVHHPKTVTRFGVTVRQYARAITRGVVAGLLG